jgi:hypothetical protein
MIKLIEILNEITEGKQVGNLYHFTPLKQIIPILSNRYLIPNSENQISTSVRANMDPDIIFDNKTNLARLTLDGDKISNKYKIRPFSYEEHDEGEEQIVVNGKNFPFLPYLKRIDFFIVKPKDKNISTVEKILQNANIKYNIYQGTPLKNIPYKQSKEGDPKDIKVNKLPISYTPDELYKTKYLSKEDTLIMLYQTQSPYEKYYGIYAKPKESQLYPGFYVYLTNDEQLNKFPLPSSLLAINFEALWYNNNGKIVQHNITDYFQNLDKDKIKSLSVTPKLIKIPMLNDPEWRKKWKYVEKNQFPTSPDHYTYYVLIPKDKVLTQL